MSSISKIDNVIADEQNLRRLIDNTDDPLWMVDTNYTIVECNSAFRKWVSLFIGTEIGKGDNVLYNGNHKSYSDKFEMCYKMALGGNAFRSVEDMIVNGEVCYTSVYFKPVTDSSNNVVGVSCFARDITEHRKHLMQLEERNATLRDIAFIESHKIRGPVATMLGLEQFYNYHDAADPINKEIMEGIRKMTIDLDIAIRKVVRMSNEIGMD